MKMIEWKGTKKITLSCEGGFFSCIFFSFTAILEQQQQQQIFSLYFITTINL